MKGYIFIIVTLIYVCNNYVIGIDKCSPIFNHKNIVDDEIKVDKIINIYDHIAISLVIISNVIIMIALILYTQDMCSAQII